MHNYRMAVTEREVRNGCITMPDDYVKDHVIIYTRQFGPLHWRVPESDVAPLP